MFPATNSNLLSCFVTLKMRKAEMFLKWILALLQVFDVAVNQHTVIKGLDIYERVGRAVGHDEYIPFRVNNNQLLIDGETVPFSGSIYVEFLKVSWEPLVLPT